MREIARQLFNELGNKSISYNAIGNPLSYGGWSYTWEGRRLMGMSRSGVGNSGSYGSLSLNAAAMTLTHTQGTQDAGDTFSMDQAGNLTVSTDKTPGSYFLAEGVLKAEEAGGSAQAVSYQYNASGLRVSKTVDGVTTQYTLHGKLITHLKKGTDELHFFYDAQGKPAMVEFNGSYYAYVHTLQGDIAAIVDNTGIKVVEYGYDAWGKPTKVWSLTHPSDSTLTSAYAKLAQLNPFRYRGYVWDEETGLYYLRSRYYDPVSCRFQNPDVMIGQLGRIFTQNRFAYCIGNPIMMIDYTGKCTCPNGHLQGDFHHYCGDVVLPFADIQGHQLLDLWMNGSVDGELICDSPEWSEYMTSNTWDITSEIIVEAAHFGEYYSMDPQDFGKNAYLIMDGLALRTGIGQKQRIIFILGI